MTRSRNAGTIEPGDVGGHEGHSSGAVRAPGGRDQSLTGQKTFLVSAVRSPSQGMDAGVEENCGSKVVTQTGNEGLVEQQRAELSAAISLRAPTICRFARWRSVR